MMLKRFFKIGAAVLMLGTLFVWGGSTIANAQASEAAGSTLTVGPRDAGAVTSQVALGQGALGMGLRYGDAHEAGLAAAAEALGISVEDLSNQLWGGRTLADIADEAGVDLAAVRTAVEDAHEAERIAAIEAAVEAGEMSQEQADWITEGIEQGYLESHHGGMGGFGGIGGHGGFGGHGHGMRGFGSGSGMGPGMGSGMGPRF